MSNMPKLPKLPSLKSLSRCECGCTGLTQSRFVPGHDSKLAGMIKRVKAGVWNKEAAGDPIAQLDALAEFLTPGNAIATANAMGLDWDIEGWAERAEARDAAVNE